MMNDYPIFDFLGRVDDDLAETVRVHRKGITAGEKAAMMRAAAHLPTKEEKLSWRAEEISDLADKIVAKSEHIEAWTKRFGRPRSASDLVSLEEMKKKLIAKCDEYKKIKEGK